MNLILIGPPGVGKGTQAELLESRLGIKPLSSGLIFRQEIEAETDLGRLAKRYIDQGRLVPNGVTIEMMSKRIRLTLTAKKGFILDGYPRTVEQAEALEELLSALGTQIDAVVALEVPDLELIQRLSGRMGCTKCGAIYHRTNKPPRRPWVCDECNSPLFVRTDDQPEAIGERLAIYYADTKPVIDFYEKRGKVCKIDARNDPESVYQEILACATR